MKRNGKTENQTTKTILISLLVSYSKGPLLLLLLRALLVCVSSFLSFFFSQTKKKAL